MPWLALSLLGCGWFGEAPEPSPLLPPPPSPSCRDAADAPTCWVEAPEASLWVMANEVCEQAFERCVEAGACRSDDVGLPLTGDARRPLVGITWQGAERLCAFLGGRLPTVAEWRRLAGPGPFVWGASPRCASLQEAERARLLNEVGTVLEACAGLLQAPEGVPDEVIALCRDPRAHRPEVVVQRVRDHMGLPSLSSTDCARSGPVRVDDDDDVDHPLGLRWLAGNVAEWTSTPDAESLGARVIVGGSFMASSHDELRVDALSGAPEDVALPDVGVRCVAGPTSR